jgi:polyferredoxin
MRYRTGIQGFFLLLITLFSLNPILQGMGFTPLPEASIHAVCPFGGVVSIYQFFTAGTFVQKIHDSSYILMMIVFLLTVLFGPVFCGWVCPLGTVQEWIGWLGKIVFKKKYNRFIPAKVDRYLRFIRYAVLLMVLYQTAYTAKLVFQDVDPYYALFHFWSGETELAALIILGVTLLLSLFVERSWCKYACPYGAVLGLFNLVRVFKIRRTASRCIGCKSCDRSCPMNNSVSTVKAVKDPSCISCMKCTSEASCPVTDTVHLSIRGESI